MAAELGSPPSASVLMVDDRPENLLALEAVLDGLGYHLVKAGSGPEALKRLLEQEFAVILLDAAMPEMDGFETAVLIRARERSQHTPIIFLTAIRQSEEHAARGYAAGALDYLVKPISPEVLRAKVAALVRLWEDGQRDACAARASRQEAEAAVRHSEGFKAAILQSALDAIITMDHDGNVVEWNPAAEAMFGYPRDEAVGRELCELIIPPRVRDAHRVGLARYLATGQGRVLGKRLELPAIRDDGTEFPVELSVTRIPTDGPPLFAGYVRDITERKRAEEGLQESNRRLVEADRRKDEFLAMLGHELRNPLGAISNATEALKHPDAEAAKLVRLRAIIDRQVRHLSRIVDDLLDVSRLTHGLIELRLEPVDLAAVVTSAVDSCGGQLSARGQTLSLSLPPQPVHLQADPARLTQILCNLLDNAAKYSEPGGQIRLSADPAQAAGDRQVVLRVKDAGVGIAPELLPHVFDLFTQGERDLQRAQGGMGLGLTLVRRLVEMHGGTITAHSEGVGKGAEFVVRLPVTKGSTMPAGARTHAQAVASAQSRRVLVVEDNVDAAEALTDLLGLWGHEVVVVYDGAAALEAAGNFRPHVVLLDIGLPGMDGYEVARRLREQSESSELRLVAITGYGQEQDRRRSREVGIDVHLVKPLDALELQHLLAAAPVNPV